MNQVFQIILIIAASIGSIGILVGGMGYYVSIYRKGGKEEKTEVISTSQQVIDFWKDQAENYRVMLETEKREWNEKFQRMSTEMGEIRGQLNAEKTQNERLEKIFQNRNPEQEKFMEMVIKAIDAQSIVNKEVVELLGEIRNLAVEEHNREVKVETTITKTPNAGV